MALTDHQLDVFQDLVRRHRWHAAGAAFTARPPRGALAGEVDLPSGGRPVYDIGCPDALAALTAAGAVLVAGELEDGTLVYVLASAPAECC